MHVTWQQNIGSTCPLGRKDSCITAATYCKQFTLCVILDLAGKSTNNDCESAIQYNTAMYTARVHLSVIVT
jgi:hypothetical protein